MQTTTDAVRGSDAVISTDTLRSIYEAVACGIHVRDASGKIVHANAETLRIFGCTAEEMLGGQALSFIKRMRPDGSELPADELYSVRALRERRPFRDQTLGLRLRDGTTRWVRVDSVPVLDDRGSVLLVITSFIDITERKQAEERLAEQALHDPLTRLPNRTLLRERIERAVVGTRRRGSSVALILLDLDRFKDVNDTFGHETGDRLLVEVAGRLQGAIRDSDTVARLGGDEFAILMPEADDSVARAAAKRLRTALLKPFFVAPDRLRIGASAGIAFAPADGTDPETLLHRADVAMYAAKRAGLGIAVYEATQERTLRRLLPQADPSAPTVVLSPR